MSSDEFSDSVDVFDAIREHVEESRYIAAKRLLDEVEDISVIPPDIPVELIELVHSQMTAIEGGDEDRWSLVKEDQDIGTYFCRPLDEEATTISVKVEATLPVSLLTAMALIHEVDLMPLWLMKNAGEMIKLLDVRKLRKPKVFDLVMYVRTQPPWPISEREQCNHYRGVDCLDEERQRVGILCHPLDDEIIPDHKPGAIRAKILEPSGFVFERVSEQVTKLRMVYTIDPWIGYVPDWLIGLFLGLIAPRILGAVQAGTEVVEREEFQERINDASNTFFVKLKQRMSQFQS